VFLLSRKLKLNLNSRLVVIFVLRLAKPLSENTKRNRSAKVKVTHCVVIKVTSAQSCLHISQWGNQIFVSSI